MTSSRLPVTLGLAALLAGCGANTDVAGVGGDGGNGSGSGGNPVCAVAIGVQPPDPVAGPTTTLIVSANAPGVRAVLAYSWQVLFNGAVAPFTLTQPDGAMIDIPAPLPGVYAVTAQLSGSSPGCAPASASINVAAPGAQTARVRLRVVTPRSVAAPPMEKLLEIKGGAAADIGMVRVDSGGLATATVMGPGGGVPAYLQFSPGGAPDAIVEAFSNASGAAAAQLVLGPYSVLVVPSAAGVVPRRIAGWSPGAVLQLDAGTTVHGAVHRDPGNVAVEGATIRLVIDGVPSTLPITATTGADGRFALAAATGGVTTVEVTPPAGSGLPRLSATSPSFDLTQSLEIRYAANVGQVDLAGTTVQTTTSPAHPIPGARVTVVGSLATVGTVTAGTQVVATGEVRIAATADGNGVLPTTPVPSGLLSAVVEVAPGALAVVALDTSAGAPATLDAASPALITTAVLDGHGAGLPGAVLELVPTGALAMAGAPALRLPAVTAGVIAATLPVGGRYQLRFQDPQGRAAPLVVPDRAAAAIASSYALPAAIPIRGTLRLDGNQALAGASVQLLCDACSGIDRTHPLVEVVSDAAGQFTLAVPDPGTR